MGKEGGRRRPDAVRLELAARVEELEAEELRDGILRYARWLHPSDLGSLLAALEPPVAAAPPNPPVVAEEREPAPTLPDLAGCRAAFRADPGPETLHHLLLAAGDDTDAVRVVAEAEISENGWSLGDTLPGDAAAIPSDGLLVRLELLAGRYGDAIERFLDADPADWTGFDHPGYPVAAFLLLAASGLCRLPEGSAIEDFWRKTDRVPGAAPDQTHFSDRLTLRLRRWPVSAGARQRFLSLIENAVKDRTRAISRVSDSGAHLAGATAVVAVAEASFLAGETAHARRFLDAMLAVAEANPEFHEILGDRAEASSILPQRAAGD